MKSHSNNVFEIQTVDAVRKTDVWETEYSDTASATSMDDTGQYRQIRGQRSEVKVSPSLNNRSGVKTT